MAASFHPARHHRRSIRLPRYDYRGAGAYFVTICTHERECLFGAVVEGSMQLNGHGASAFEEWWRTATARPEVALLSNEFVVMPNHVHGILWIGSLGQADDDGQAPRAERAWHLRCDVQSAPPVASGSLGAIVRSYKSAVARRVNMERCTPGLPVWQRNYYEHVIRTPAALEHIRAYIANNPARWDVDTLFPR